MTSTQTKAQAALDIQLENNITDIAITYPNIPYTPSVTEPYIRVAHRPGRKFQASLGEDGLNRISGTMFVYVSYPVGTYIGTYDAYNMADRVIALFENGTVLTYEDVTVRTTLAQRVGDLEGDVRFIPTVEVEWYAYVSRDTTV